MAFNRDVSLSVLKHRRAFARSTAGNIATLTALMAPATLALAAFAIDEGALYLERRELQSLTDLAAISAAANIDNAEKTVLAVLRDNGFGHAQAGEALPYELQPGEADAGGGAISVVTGNYEPDPSKPATARFVAGATPTNAVRVSIRHAGTRYFAAGMIGTPMIGAEAVASARAEAAFSVGSRLVRLDGGIANALLGGLTGSTISLSVMDYDALVSADIRLLSLFDQLDTNLDLNAAIYSKVLDSDVTIGQLLTAMRDIGGFGASASVALTKLKTATAGSSQTLSLSKLFDLGSTGQLPLGASPTGPDPMIGAMELISAAAGVSLANGEHQVEVDLGASVAGLASAQLTLSIGEPAQFSPWFGIGSSGTLVKTAQTRLLLDIKVGGPGGLLGTSINLPIYIELANAEAKLSRVTCPAGSSEDISAVVAARPGIATVRIAQPNDAALADFDRSPALIPAQIVSTLLLKISGTAEAAIANRNFTMVPFSASEIENRTIKRVSTTDIIGSLTQSLLGSLQLQVNAAGLGLGVPGNIATLLANALAPATPAIDSLIGTALTTLGVTLGEADIRIHGASCGRPVLVQ